MPLGYDYRCQPCGHHWMLYTKSFFLGPPLWGNTKYTCFSCQTFLAVPGSVDRHSWSIWLRDHEGQIAENAILLELAFMITNRLQKRRRFTPVELKFDIVLCPTCQERMSTVPLGEQLMKCPKCGQFTGEFDDSNGIYEVVDLDWPDGRHR